MLKLLLMPMADWRRYFRAITGRAARDSAASLIAASGFGDVSVWPVGRDLLIP